MIPAFIQATLLALQLFLVLSALRNWAKSKQHLREAKRLLHRAGTDYHNLHVHARETGDDTIKRVIKEFYLQNRYSRN